MENTLTRSDERVQDTVTLSFTGRVAKWSARHRWWVVAVSVMAIAMAVFASHAVDTKLLDDNAIAEGESGEAIRLLDERFGEGGASTEHLVFRLAEVAVPREVFRQVLERISGLHAAPG